ncbi:MBL fold metallo-hydrolase [Bacillus sp. B15-48]|uniref:MBL fold metallo-hydrolase n=1 Tax=Bacillus sp. B15-48 TaxID=1548601 RepID=UPI00193EF0D0|nr:MBL fold metallo-hydrolase [Bacillus sp. B15-48]
MHRKKELKVIRIPIPTPTLYPHTTTNCYLVGNEDECLLVDAGYDSEETKINLNKAIAQHQLAIPKKIILTHSHPDHALGVRQLTNWDAVVSFHKEEKSQTLEAIAPYKKISTLDDEDRMTIGGEQIIILHTPGHTPGHLGLYLPSSQILIAGDNIVAEGTTWIGPPDGDMTDYIQSLNRLKTLNISKIAPGHGNWVTKPYEQIEFVLSRRLFRESQIITLLKEHKQVTSRKLTEIIYESSIHPSVFNVAKLTIEAHLHKLVQEGVVDFIEPNYSLVV